MKLEFLMELSATLRENRELVGIGPLGTRTVVPATGGSFECPRLKGVLPTGGDWILGDVAGVRRLDVRATIETDDGALIYVMYYGVSKEEPNRLRTTWETKYGEIYFMTAPRFETG